MMYLVYAYIHKYRCLKDVGLSLDSRYDCRYNKDTKTLSISYKPTLPNTFWDAGGAIHSIAAVVGDNGAGKSTALSFLLDAIVEGKHDSVNGILVYEQNNLYRVYGGQGIVINADKEYNLEKEVKSINTFYYSGHFLPYVDNRDLRTYELQGSYIGSDIWKLVKDAQDYSNVDSIHLNHPFVNHLYAYVGQNNYRICMLLANRELRAKIKYGFPRYIRIDINTSGKMALSMNPTRFSGLREKVPNEPDLTSSDSECQFVARWVYHVFLNILTDCQHLNSPKQIIRIIERWLISLKSSKDVIGCAEMSLNQFDIDEKTCLLLKSLLNYIKTIRSLSKSAKDEQGNTVFYLDVDNDSENLKRLSLLLSGGGTLLASKVCDLKYCQDFVSMESILSSGEMEMLNMFSRLYDAISLQPKRFDDINPTPLIMLDEAETGFHPDWQRQYLQSIIDFIIAIPVSSNMHYQIILTTHSPMLLSDLPKCCVNFLKKEESTTNNVRNEEKETFASNVFDLYRRSFFMKNGLIGAFAQRKIENLHVRIMNGGDTVEIEKEISMIGDDRIRQYLFKLLLDTPAKEIEYHKRRIAYLEQQK